jgi:very-short-patch-repair endonuclease/DNA polymerase III delta prime subunit
MTSRDAQLQIGRKRVEQVFRFLEALNQHRNPAVRRLDEQIWHLWLRNLPDHPCVQIGALGTSSGTDRPAGEQASDFILRVRRPKLTNCPIPPAVISPWLERGWEEPSGTVRLRPTRNEIDNGVTVIVSFEDDSKRTKALGEWRRQRDTWASSEQLSRSAMAVFEKLYEIRGQVEREGENVELVLGDGTLSWKKPDGSIFHPILLQRLQLDFDPTIPEFTLAEAESPVELYGALFQSLTDVDGKTIARLRSDLDLGKYHPLGKEDTSGFLRSVSVQLSPHGEFSAAEAARANGDHPIVGRSPVVFLRKRTLGFAISLEAAIQNVASGGEIPLSLLRVVGIESGEGEIGESQPLRSWLEETQPMDVLLSKPANPEQIKIAQRLDGHGSVLVQGPPGTGKTHTIANLIGHLLSQGKSVLVTSHTSKALRVLRNHVVTELQPLCVSVLDSDVESRKQLESTVDSIVSKLSMSDVSQMERRAADLEQQRSGLIDQYRRLANEMLNARFDEFRDVIVAGEPVSPSFAARFVRDESPSLSFIPGPVELGAPLPLVEQEFYELYRTNGQVTPEDEAELGGRLPSIRDLPTPSEFERLVEERLSENRGRPPIRNDLWNSPTDDEEKLGTLLTVASAIAGHIRNCAQWQLEAMQAGYEGAECRRPWESLLKLIDEAWQTRSEAADLILTHDPVLPVGWHEDELESVSEELRIHTANGGTLSFVTLVRRSSWKRFIREAKTAAGEPRRAEHFESLQRAARLNALRSRLTARWAKQMVPLGGAAIEDLGPEPEVGCRQVADILRRCLSWGEDIWHPFEQQLQEVGFLFKRILDEQPPQAIRGGQLLRLADTIEGPVRKSVQARLAELRVAAITALLRTADELLKEASADDQVTKVVARLRAAISRPDTAAYAEAFSRLQDLCDRRKHLIRRQELLDKLRPSAPGWAAAIGARVDAHADSQPRPRIKDAWRWRQFTDELDRRAAASLRDLQDRLSRVEQNIRTCTAELIEQKAWAAQLRRTERNLQQKQALVGWLDTVKKMGKGTGIRVPKLKAEANRLMTQCRGAVPVWIMPLSRVADNFDPRTARFDVVIIDEASQSDVMGLLAFYMADKAIVVGDHEQVSPLAVGQELSIVQHLIDEFLDGVPNSHLYDGQTSIYDLARQSFGGTIRLVEHFRCVPEIIQFSNQLSYEGAIKPLRDASSVTLKPHVIAHRVADGFGAGKRNEIEAEETAALILAAAEQPEYSGKSIGVISMVGDEQAILIDSILRRNLSEEEFKLEHNILCGKPEHFQGDERDVMFLSVVDSSDGGVLRMREEQMFKQRFNVAASRARDQMWVVHSIDPRSHLKPGDLRRRLIEYAEDPGRILRALDSLEAEAESDFELEVAARLTRLGYKVVPQWRVGHYRIDIVVVGANEKRLAVECDGDRYHPIEKLPDDMARQAVLERLGWTFVRLRGSQFFRDPDATLEPLLQRLRKLEIEPQAVTEDQAESAEPIGSELRSRVVRRAHEILREWRGTPKSADRTGASQELRLAPKYQDHVKEFGFPPQQSLASESAVFPTGIDESDDEEDAPIPDQPSLFGGVKLSKDVTADEVRAAIHSAVPEFGRTDRETVIRKVAQTLGFVRVSKPLRSRINKTIGAEVRYGRLSKDSEWNFIWRDRP